MKYFYVQSDNNTLEKNKLVYKYFDKQLAMFGKFLQYVTSDFDYFLEILDLFMNSTFFNSTQKSNIYNYKLLFNERKAKLKRESPKNKTLFM